MDRCIRETERPINNLFLDQGRIISVLLNIEFVSPLFENNTFANDTEFCVYQLNYCTLSWIIIHDRCLLLTFHALQ